MSQQQQREQNSVPELLREIRECRKATCLAAMRDLRKFSGRSVPVGGIGRRISLAAASGTENLLDGAAELLPGRKSSRVALEDLLTELTRKRVLDRDETYKKRRFLGDLETRYCRLLLEEERSLRRLAEELSNRRPEACAKLMMEPALQECLRRSQLRLDHDKPAGSGGAAAAAAGGAGGSGVGGESIIQRLMRGAVQAAETVELNMNLDSCLTVGLEMYSQLGRICHQMETVAGPFDSGQALTTAQLMPALTWWLDRASYTQDRREIEREYKGD